MKEKRGLSYASEETKQRVGSKGGNAPHKSRGLQSVDPERRKEIASKGGLARKRKLDNELQRVWKGTVLERHYAISNG